jgi:flagellar protein FliO/FliZ
MNSVAVAQGLLSLLCVVGLILLLGWLLRGRLRPLRASGRHSLQVLAQLALGARERIVVVQVGEEQLLVGVSPGGLRTLLVLSRPLQVETGVAAPATSFAQRVRDAMQGGTGTA